MVPFGGQQRYRSDQSKPARLIFRVNLTHRILHPLITPVLHYSVRVKAPDLAGPTFVHRVVAAPGKRNTARLKAIQPTDRAAAMLRPDIAARTHGHRNHG